MPSVLYSSDAVRKFSRLRNLGKADSEAGSDCRISQDIYVPQHVRALSMLAFSRMSSNS